MEKAKLFISLILSQDADLKLIESTLAESFSEIDYESPVMDFTMTDYYYEEMGKPLKRKFISFKSLILSQDLADIKNQTCEIERSLALLGNRRVNIDPGYITHAKVVLASTKNFYHRIYIGKSIFAELTMAYAKGDFKTFEWTYPDYSTREYKNILSDMRSVFADQIKSGK